MYLRLADYAAVSFGNSVFIYGGNDGKAEMRTVAEYRNGAWNKVGDMLYTRFCSFLQSKTTDDIS